MNRSSNGVQAAVVSALLLVGWGAGDFAQAAESGWVAYQTGKFEEAQKLYEEKLEQTKSHRQRAQLSFGLAAAAYRVGDFEVAKQALAESLQYGDRGMREEAHFNMGNALFQSGWVRAGEKGVRDEQWKAAIDHYEAALKLNQRHQGAKRNLEYLKQLMQNQEDPDSPPDDQQDDQQNQDQQQQDQSQDQQDQNQEQNQDPKNQEDPNQDQNQSPPPQGDPEQEDPNQDPPKNDPKQDPPKDDPNQNQPPPPPNENPEGQPENQDASQQPPPKPKEREWSPSEARQILENNADEDRDVRPLETMPVSGQGYKNW